MSAIATSVLPAYLREEILLHPEKREFPAFDLVRLLGTVFAPTEDCRVCVLVDFDEPADLIKDFEFLQHEGFLVQKNAHRYFHQGLRDCGAQSTRHDRWRSVRLPPHPWFQPRP